MIPNSLHRFLCVSLCLLCAFVVSSSAAEPLPNTKALTDEGNLSTKQVEGMHKYLDRELAAAAKNRDTTWKKGDDAQHRAALKKSLGLVDARLAPRMEFVSGPGEPAVVAESAAFTVYAVRWAVLPGVDGEGLLLEPKGKVKANVVAIPDALWTPEQIAGLTKDEKIAFAQRLAEHGCRVVIPVLIDRNDNLSGSEKLKRATNIPHREFVHRMAYEMGRTLVGYEVQKVLAAVDWFQAKDKSVPVGLIGVGEGGRVALYAAASDTRVKALHVACAFGPREGVHEEPLDRNLWNEVREFGDAEAASLVANQENPMGRVTVYPRPNVKEKVSEGAWPEWAGPNTKGPKQAAPGGIKPVPDADAARELKRYAALLPRASRIRGNVNAPDNAYGFRDLLHTLEGDGFAAPDALMNAVTDGRKGFDPAARHKRQFDQLVGHVQKLWRDSDATRKEFWAKADAKSPEAWEKSCDWYRDYFHTEVIGKLPEPTIPLNPRTRQIYDEKTWTGYEVTLDVYDDVFAYGILLLPKDLKPGEKRPVVVCQHGLEGTPEGHDRPSNRGRCTTTSSRRLAELGYIVYAPQNPYYGENKFRQLQRKANPLKLSLFCFIIRQHQRTLDWLETLPVVDPKRIAFYGLSYGGKTAMRVPAVEKRYCLSICSGDFNEWVGKNVSIDLDRSYMWTGEYEMYEFDLGNTFNYAEMAYLIAPRPFMVERGHDDGVGTDEMVAYEFAKVRYLYANRLKIPDRTTIEWFVGWPRDPREGDVRVPEAEARLPQMTC